MTTATHELSKFRPNNTKPELPVYEKLCLARVGRTGTKSHRAVVLYQVKDEGKPWEKRIILDTWLTCKMMGGTGRMYSRGVITMFDHGPERATCKHCKA